MDDRFLSVTVEEYIRTIKIGEENRTVDEQVAAKVQEACALISLIMREVHSEDFTLDIIPETDGISIGVVCEDAIFEDGSSVAQPNNTLRTFLELIQSVDGFSVTQGSVPDTICLMFQVNGVWKRTE